MVIDLVCRDDEATSISGVVAIIDLKGAGLGHATSMTPSMIRKAVNSWQDVTPIRTKSMYFINTPYNVHLVLNIFKKFMKEKLRQRVCIFLSSHSNSSSSYFVAMMLPL